MVGAGFAHDREAAAVRRRRQLQPGAPARRSGRALRPRRPSCAHAGPGRRRRVQLERMERGCRGPHVGHDRTRCARAAFHTRRCGRGTRLELLGALRCEDQEREAAARRRPAPPGAQPIDLVRGGAHRRRSVADRLLHPRRARGRDRPQRQGRLDLRLRLHRYAGSLRRASGSDRSAALRIPEPLRGSDVPARVDRGQRSRRTTGHRRDDHAARSDHHAGPHR